MADVLSLRLIEHLRHHRAEEHGGAVCCQSVWSQPDGEERSRRVNRRDHHYIKRLFGRDVGRVVHGDELIGAVARSRQEQSEVRFAGHTDFSDT